MNTPTDQPRNRTGHRHHHHHESCHRPDHEERSERRGRSHRRNFGPRGFDSRDFGPRDFGPRGFGPRDFGPRDSRRLTPDQRADLRATQVALTAADRALRKLATAYAAAISATDPTHRDQARAVLANARRDLRAILTPEA